MAETCEDTVSDAAPPVDVTVTNAAGNMVLDSTGIADPERGTERAGCSVDPGGQVETKAPPDGQRRTQLEPDGFSQPALNRNSRQLSLVDIKEVSKLIHDDRDAISTAVSDPGDRGRDWLTRTKCDPVIDRRACETTDDHGHESSHDCILDNIRERATAVTETLLMTENGLRSACGRPGRWPARGG